MFLELKEKKKAKTTWGHQNLYCKSHASALSFSLTLQWLDSCGLWMNSLLFAPHSNAEQHLHSAHLSPHICMPYALCSLEGKGVVPLSLWGIVSSVPQNSISRAPVLKKQFLMTPPSPASFNLQPL